MIFKIDKFPEDKKIKYPKRMQGEKEIKVFEENKYYWVQIQRSNKSALTYLLISVTVVLAACLFPVWPFWLKVGIWATMVAGLVSVVTNE